MLDAQFLDEKQMDAFISNDEKPFTMGIPGAKKGKGGRKVSGGHVLSLITRSSRVMRCMMATTAGRLTRRP